MIVLEGKSLIAYVLTRFGVAQCRSRNSLSKRALIDHSDISPFRINDLQSCLKGNIGDCDKSSNVPRSLTGFSSIAAPLTARSAK